MSTRVRQLFQHSDAVSSPGAVPTEANGAHESRAAIEQLTGHPVGNLSVYEQALTHRSALRSTPGANHLQSNERLEFLGDAILGSVVAEALFRQLPEKNEGYLTRLRAKLVSGRALAGYAQDIGLGPHLRLSENMDRTNGRTNRTILSDAFEALIGALYLDQGFEAAHAFIQRTALAGVSLADLAARQENYKSLLLEYVQARGQTPPRYRVTHEDGPSHKKIFTVEVLVGGEPHGEGTASSKKKAEQQAASEALEQLRTDET